MFYTYSMFRSFFAWTSRYERHLSAGAMLVGAVLDQLFFGRVDLWQTQAVFAGYAAICFISIPLLHYLEARALQGHARPRWRSLLPIVTQFALGGFWSGFLVFYGRSAVISASWPFLLLVVVVFIGNELLSRYHDRLVFTTTLFFFALYSYAIFAVPIYTGTIGTGTFILSGVIAVIVFALFTALLRILGRERFLHDVWRMRIGASIVLILINVFYFTNILPPLPLAAKAAGVYHAVWREPGAYLAKTEPQSWRVRYLGTTPTLHVVSGDSLYAYSSIFAPTTLETTVVHRWQWYNPTTQEWVTRAAISYPILGGRDGGYRGYSAVLANTAGDWRVNIETINGLLIERLVFAVEIAALPPEQKTITLP